MNRFSFAKKIAAAFIVSIVLIMVAFSPAFAEEKPITVAPAEIRSSAIKPPAAESTVIMPLSAKINRNTLGCVLPLSGQYAEWGNKARDAILLATATVNEQNKPIWKVIFKDSQGLPEGTKTAIANLADTENVMAVIAITGTLEAMDAASEASKWKVPLILITPKEGVTSTSEYVFQHFLTPTQQIRAMVKYALDDLNCAIFSILYPKDDYGEEILKIFSQEVIRIGGKVEKAIPYSKNQTDFKEEINKLTGTIVNAPQKKRDKQAENKTAISVDFEALFIPDSPSRVKLIISQLDFYDVKGFQLLGTSLWHSPDLLNNGTASLEGAVFVDSFFTNSFYPETNNFVDIYVIKYSREPENIEALAYDTAGIIIGVLDNKEIKTRGQFAAAMKKVENYKGATGNISFSSDRVSQKTPFILKVKKGKFEQVK
jgi:ABC-type branched-subunit amino acid transport system substrate-binding protein